MIKYQSSYSLSSHNQVLESAGGLLDLSKPEEIEELAREASRITRQYFGRAISLYAPLYLSNFCENQCVYCGFNSKADIVRRQLSPDEIKKECRSLAETGIQDILLLTGESRRKTPVSYIIEAINTAKEFFPYIGLEIYPLKTDEYRACFRAGADSVTIYQETYNRKLYAKLHPAKQKSDYDFRYNTPERIIRSGMRQLSMGALLGLNRDWKEDVLSLFRHLLLLQSRYPGVEYSLSFPRFKKSPKVSFECHPVNDIEYVKILSAARLTFPRVSINISTREPDYFRNNVLPLGITRMSAGSLTSVGGYSDIDRSENPGQFSTSDTRSVKDVKEKLITENFDPVFTSWRRISNE